MTDVGAEVFLEDGRRAIYAGEIDGQKFVRILLSRDDEEYGVEEWPSDKLTPVSRILTSPPCDLYEPAIKAAQADLEALRGQISVAREQVQELQEQRKSIESAIAKFPDVRTAIAFLEGSLTHLVVTPSYGASKLTTVSEYLSAKSDRGRSEGVKLLCLFGIDENRKCRWRVNQYYDGSGSWTEVVPFASEADALSYMREQFEAELALWRSGESSHKLYYRAESIPKSEWPQDWRDYVAAAKAKSAQDRIEKLRQQIAEIEAEAVQL